MVGKASFVSSELNFLIVLSIKAGRVSCSYNVILGFND